MTRMVKHKHGLNLVDDNIWCVHDRYETDEEQQVRDGYRCVVFADGYNLPNGGIHIMFFGMRTPAQQVMWEEATAEETIIIDGKEHVRPFDYRRMRGWLRMWLNEEIGKERVAWDVRSKNLDYSPEIFFMRRKDALKFVRFMVETLDKAKIN